MRMNKGVSVETIPSPPHIYGRGLNVLVKQFLFEVFQNIKLYMLFGNKWNRGYGGFTAHRNLSMDQHVPNRCDANPQTCVNYFCVVQHA